jgi:hypothetical protein
MSDNLNIADMANLVEKEAEEVTKSQQNKDRLIMLSLSSGGKWNLLQEYMIEIEADCKLKEGLGQRFPTYVELLQLLKKKIEVEYSEDESTMKSLLNCVPLSKNTVSYWRKMSGWTEAVLDKMKSFGLFTPEKRAEVIESLRKKASEGGDVQAAKVWLTMSGDYTDKVDVNDTKFEKYKEYANSLRPIKVTDEK